MTVFQPQPVAVRLVVADLPRTVPFYQHMFDFAVRQQQDDLALLRPRSCCLFA
ncbi:MAG: hypothetical protein MUE40_08680 [Anaerolineae bacterium]|jgi:predicted enzyme related to lactoylglutathione lyase|nr:hypothetical protein [Anaerolineae bacterium]